MKVKLFCTELAKEIKVPDNYKKEGTEELQILSRMVATSKLDQETDRCCTACTKSSYSNRRLIAKS